MQSQKLCLKWNNHTSNLLSVLGSFQQNESLVDVTISCEGHNIKAHKIVLSACSPYFQDIFLENPCKHPIIFMNGMKFEDVAAILNFMYKGEVNVSHDGLSSFLQAAEALKVKGLAEVCGEKHSTNSISQEVQQSEQNRPQRTDTPPRKRQRNRKRSLSDSNRSDDEGSSRKHREPSSPEVHELSGDESFTGDNSSNGTPFNSTPRVPQKAFSRSHQSSNLGDEDDYEMEAEKLLEQNMTTESASVNNSTDNNLRIERIMGNATEMESSSLQEPESPPDIKPIINFGESSTGASEGALMPYNEQSQFSQPGPSSASDSTLLHDNSHAQGYLNSENISPDKLAVPLEILPIKSEHIENHEIIPRHLCINCGEIFENQDKLDVHIKIHFPEKINRPVCNRYFNYTSALNQNESDSLNLSDHQKRLPFTSYYYPYVCTYCKEGFESETFLNDHLETHSVDNRCPICYNHFLCKYSLRRHMKSKHPNLKNIPFVCRYCKESFKFQDLLINHLKINHSKNYKCYACDKYFISVSALENHKKNSYFCS